MENDSTNAQAQAQAKFQSTVARLGQNVWFTLESSARASQKDPDNAWESRLAAETTGTHGDSLASRQSWSTESWIAFWTTNNGLEVATRVFLANTSSGENTYNPEKELLDAFGEYVTFYQTLPGTPETTVDDDTINNAGKRVNALLGTFQDGLGDPVMPCQVCGKRAIGSPLKRCSRCKQAFYCGAACQRIDWPSHKRSCKAPNAKQLNKLVSKRYTELRRQGKDSKLAMTKARAEYGLTDADKKQLDAGKQVAAMFGMSI